MVVLLLPCPLPDEARRVLEAEEVRLIELQRKVEERLLSLIGQARVLIAGFTRIDREFWRRPWVWSLLLHGVAGMTT